MRTHRGWLLVAVLVAALVLAACGSPSGEGAAQPANGEDLKTGAVAPTSTPTAMAQPTATPVATETAAEQPESGEAEQVEVRDLEVAGLTSYRSKTTTETNDDGKVSISTVTTEYSAEGPATHIVVTADGKDTVEIIRIGQDSYMKGAESDEWLAMSSADQEAPEQSTGLFQWEDPNTVLNSEDCEFKGNEVIDGQQTKHYHCESAALAAADAATAELVMKSAYRDYYISTDLMIMLKSVVYWEGTSDGKAFSYKMESTVTDVNKPIAIVAPEGVAAPGPSEDMPIPEDAQELMSFGTMVSFSLAQSVADTAAWYESEMPANGWTLNTAATTTSDEMVQQSWTKDSRTANVMISASDNGVSVVIMSGEE